MIFGFYLTSQFNQSSAQIGKLLPIAAAGVFTCQIQLLSPNQQC